MTCNVDGSFPEMPASYVRQMVMYIYESRRQEPCWYGDRRCGNWPTCVTECALRTLGYAAGLKPQADGGVDKQLEDPADRHYTLPPRVTAYIERTEEIVKAAEEETAAEEALHACKEHSADYAEAKWHLDACRGARLEAVRANRKVKEETDGDHETSPGEDVSG